MEKLPKVEDVVKKSIFNCDMDIEARDFVGDLVQRSIDKIENTVKLLRYNTHFTYVRNIDHFFKYFRCPTCDTIFHRSYQFNRNLLRCKE